MTDKLKLDIPVLLPQIPDAADACVGRLVATLKAKPGVEEAHVLSFDCKIGDEVLGVSNDGNQLS